MAQNKPQKKSTAEKVAEAKVLVEDVYRKMHLILQPESYVQFLNAVETFHWYSCANILLIYFKFPQARYVAEFQIWKNTCEDTYNEPNRMALKYSEIHNAIRIIAPFTIGGESLSTRRLIPVSVSVYDVSQMNELPIPPNDFLDLKKFGIEDIINAVQFVSPYRMRFASGEDVNITYNVRGYCDHEQKQIVVDSMLAPRSLLCVLLHEFTEAAIYLAEYHDETLKRLVIESIYYVLLKHFKISTDDITFSYVARFKGATNQELARAFSIIQYISHSIIEQIEDQLEYLSNLLPVEEDHSYQTCFDDFQIMQGIELL